jgi:hypothetical protein
MTTIVGKQGTTCSCVYCKGDEARITKESPGVNVPTDPERRKQWLLRIWQSKTNDKSSKLIKRVKKEIEDCVKCLENCKRIKAAGGKVTDADRPRRIRIHKSHLPEGSFNTVAGKDFLNDDALPYNFEQYPAYVKNRQHAAVNAAVEELHDGTATEQPVNARAARVLKRTFASVDTAEVLRTTKAVKRNVDDLARECTRLEEELASTQKLLEEERAAHSKTRQDADADLAKLRSELEKLEHKIQSNTVLRFTFDNVCHSCARTVLFVHVLTFARQL